MGERETRSDEEVQEHLRELFALLDSDVTQLHARWKMYKQLYMENRPRLELLHHSASWVFEQIRRILLDDVILGIARLTDPPRMGKHDNQSLGSLSRRLKKKHAPLQEALNSQLQDLKGKCEPFRYHRDKRVVHRDLRAHLDPEASPLPPLPREKFDDALNAISEFMNEFREYFGETLTAYEHVITPYGKDVDWLVWTLQKAGIVDTFFDKTRVGELVQLTRFKDA